MDLTVLFRPVGQREYELIEAAGFRRFPPRLAEQPFFYPVTNEDYASQIARDWNTKDEASGWVGYVLRFSIQFGVSSGIPCQNCWFGGASRVLDTSGRP
ncbi:MAG TPA: hypothetical protein VKU19_23255 [Bryobacteraceae bacterium]|nr:hypothetical protein [Bryobacteraceae bacterium]